MIPALLNLRADQKAKLLAWAKTLPPKNVWDTEEQVTPTSSITFHCYATGIGDEVWASTHVDGKELRCVLSIDDDGRLVD